MRCVQEQYPRQFQPRALELIAKRISAATGDMRTALAVCNAARTAAARGVRQQSSAGAALGSHSQSCDPNQGTSLDAGGNSSSIDVQQAGCESGSGAANTELISVSQAAEALRVCSSGGSAQAQVRISLQLRADAVSSSWLAMRESTLEILAHLDQNQQVRCCRVM